MIVIFFSHLRVNNEKKKQHQHPCARKKVHTQFSESKKKSLFYYVRISDECHESKSISFFLLLCSALCLLEKLSCGQSLSHVVCYTFFFVCLFLVHLHTASGTRIYFRKISRVGWKVFQFLCWLYKIKNKLLLFLTRFYRQEKELCVHKKQKEEEIIADSIYFSFLFSSAIHKKKYLSWTSKFIQCYFDWVWKKWCVHMNAVWIFVPIKNWVCHSCSVAILEEVKCVVYASRSKIYISHVSMDNLCLWCNINIYICKKAIRCTILHHRDNKIIYSHISVQNIELSNV